MPNITRRDLPEGSAMTLAPGVALRSRFGQIRVDRSRRRHQLSVRRILYWILPISALVCQFAQGATSGDWALKGGGEYQQQYSSLDQINVHSISKLGLAWSLDIDSPMGLASEPIVVGGVAYVSAPQSIVYAVQVSTGQQLWRFDPKVRLDAGINNSYAARVNRGVAVSDGKVYVATGDCRLVAIDAVRGTQAWQSQICDPQVTGSTGAPRVGGGKVFIGYNGSDDQVRGSIVAYDQSTGREAWRFWTVPGDPAKGFETEALRNAAKTWTGSEWWWHGGGAVWDAITYDPATGLVIFATASAHRGEGTTSRPTSGGTKLFSGCIVAVHADTGKYAWHVQTSTPERQSENFHVVLADITLSGKMRHVAMTVPRNGLYYVIDARSGEVISRQAIYRQPVSTRAPDPYGYVEGCEGCWSVHNWWPMSFNPITKLTYVPVVDVLDRAAPYGDEEDHNLIGRLVAWDPVSQKARWSATNTVMVNSGVLSTGGGIVFQGQGSGELSAYDAGTGRRLWSMQTGSAIHGVPVSAAVMGEQYILVPVGWGSAYRLFGAAAQMTTESSKYGPSRLLAFKLGGSATLTASHAPIPPVPKPPQRIGTSANAREGQKLADSHMCTGCHGRDLDGSGRWVLNGAVPDLRYMPEQAHRDWYAIVLGGSHKSQGMLAFGMPQHYPEIEPLTPAQADDIHAYVIDQSWQAYEASQLGKH